MKKTRKVIFRVDQSQYERMCNNASAKGFVNISQFLRHLALDKDLFFEKNMKEIKILLLEIKDNINR